MLVSSDILRVLVILNINLLKWDLFFQMLTNVQLTPITAMQMPTAPTPRARSIARVIRDILEMESRVWVSSPFLRECL